MATRRKEDHPAAKRDEAAKAVAERSASAGRDERAVAPRPSAACEEGDQRTSAGGCRRKRAPAKQSSRNDIPELDVPGMAGKSLVIVESPAKAKTIGKYLGRGYRVRATVGHIMDLPEKKLGIDIENGFEPELVPIPGKEKTHRRAARARRRSRSQVYIATDPDREGEAIAWHVARQIKPKRGAPRAVERVLFHEITKRRRAARDRERRRDRRARRSKRSRRVACSIVSSATRRARCSGRRCKKGLSAGRVQTVALRLIVEREREIRAFKPVEYWTDRGAAREGRAAVHGASCIRSTARRRRSRNEAEAQRDPRRR